MESKGIYTFTPYYNLEHPVSATLYHPPQCPSWNTRTLDTYSHIAGLQKVTAKRFDEAFNTIYNKAESEPVEMFG